MSFSEVLGILIALTGLVYAFINRRRFFKLSYAIVNRNIIDEETKVASLTIGGKNVETLSKTRIILKNEGNQIFNISDVANDDIRLTVGKDDKVFLLTATYQSYSHNKKAGLSRNISINDLKLIFDRLLPQDCIIIDLYHSALSCQEVSLSCKFKRDQTELIREDYDSVLTPTFFRPGWKIYLKALLWAFSGLIVFREILNPILIPYLYRAGIEVSIDVILIIETTIVFLASIAYSNSRYWTNIRNIRNL